MMAMGKLKNVNAQSVMKRRLNRCRLIILHLDGDYLIVAMNLGLKIKLKEIYN
jgi:uncharacterized protein YaiL (DUF2058 family)